MKYELVLSEDQITQVKKQGLKVEILDDKVTQSGGLFISIDIENSIDLLSLFYAGSYYALSRKITA
jgi:2-phospho-L-lactate guanylyltransferase (CobY/MobA/RfbA family)